MASIPMEYRASLRAALEELTTGGRPELLVWVHAYGPSGTALIQQPADIWENPRSDFMERGDGTAWVTLPLWTTEESPSDLSAECEIGTTGEALVSDLHVL